MPICNVYSASRAARGSAFLCSHRLGSCALLLAVGLVASACSRFEDCDLYGTCEGALHEAVLAATGDAGPDCAACLASYCREATASCESDFGCNRAARCMLKQDPVAYQTCLAELFEDGYSNGEENGRPWEGPSSQRGNEKFVALRTCMDHSCSQACGRELPDWNCDYEEANDSRSTLQLEVAVRDMNFYHPIADAVVRFCPGADTPCGDEARTNANGRASLPGARELFDPYLEIEAASPDYPKTIYYTGQFGSARGQQPIAVYLVPTALVASFNEELKFDKRILMNAGQSAIWPDSCNRLRPLFAPDLFFTVAEREVSWCQTAPPGSPCVWYTGASSSSSLLSNVEGTLERGGGIAALPDGTYTVGVCDRQEVLRARRRVLMRGGWLTIARTWPLTRREKNIPEPGVNIACPKVAP